MSESGTAATSAMVIRNPPFPSVYPTQGRTPAYCCKPTIALRRRLTKFVQGRIGAGAFSPTGKFARAPTSCARWSNLGGFGLVFGLVQKIHPVLPLIVFPAKAGIHISHGHRPEPVLGPAKSRTRGPV